MPSNVSPTARLAISIVPRLIKIRYVPLMRAAIHFLGSVHLRYGSRDESGIMLTRALDLLTVNIMLLAGPEIVAALEMPWICLL
jgi:hypothetical protein